MRAPLARVFLASLLCVLAGCASKSELTARKLDREHPQFTTSSCQDSLAAAETHRDLKKARTIASPLVLMLSGGLLLPVVAANAAIDTVDHVDAAKMAEHCGSTPQTKAEMATDVAVGAAVGVATSGLTGSGIPGTGLASK